MEQNQYLIGDVAQIVGVSKDTLRLYEKKGIIPTRKKKNGYHYYTEDDIFQLSSILYHRKMDIGLEQIENLWCEDHTFHTYESLTHEKIQEVQETIQRHQRILGRLNAIQEDYHRIHQHLGYFSIQSIPDGFILDSCPSPLQAIIRYFQLSQEHIGLDLAYTYDYYQYQAGLSIGESSLNPTKAYVYFYADYIPAMYLDYDFSNCPKISPCPCLYTVMNSNSRKPDIHQIEELRQWALSQGIIPGAEVISSYIMRGTLQGAPTYYLDIFIPIIESERA